MNTCQAMAMPGGRVVAHILGERAPTEWAIRFGAELVREARAQREPQAVSGRVGADERRSRPRGRRVAGPARQRHPTRTDASTAAYRPRDAVAEHDARGTTAAVEGTGNAGDARHLSLMGTQETRDADSKKRKAAPETATTTTEQLRKKVKAQAEELECKTALISELQSQIEKDRATKVHAYVFRFMARVVT